MDIQYLIEDFLDTKNIQEWINNRFKNEEKIVIDALFFELFPILTMADGVKFYNTSEIQSICEVFKDYIFSDILSDDIIIDIGANAGGFSIPAAKISPNVHAVEPLLVNTLKRNAELNKLNIHIIEGALGNGEKQEISWGTTRKFVDTYTFSSLKKICEGKDRSCISIHCLFSH